ncbi:hypothetical protein [Pseudidiomarina mangrovi]|uniref:hypothetical protein n=1 Tax=Pseudidiomarina mangrovi TaxID=2487133 RepID=UPI000FCCD31F|nr:hypothetical protein [Pseudidiomarina mangrovi]
MRRCALAADVTVDPKKKQVTAFERTYEEKSGAGAVNGMLNTTGYAVTLMAKHLIENYGSSNFMLAYNLTEGMWADLWESSQNKFGFTTAVVQQFSQIINNANAKGGGNWVAHSQGGVIFAEAMRVNLKNGTSSLANIRVQFDAGANNRWVTNGYARQLGVAVNGYRDHPFDLVPQIVGGRGLLNPFKLLGSLAMSPFLAAGPGLSPHTLPYKEND